MYIDSKFFYNYHPVDKQLFILGDLIYEAQVLLGDYLITKGRKYDKARAFIQAVMRERLHVSLHYHDIDFNELNEYILTFLNPDIYHPKQSQFYKNMIVDKTDSPWYDVSEWVIDKLLAPKFMEIDNYLGSNKWIYHEIKFTGIYAEVLKYTDFRTRYFDVYLKGKFSDRLPR